MNYWKANEKNPSYLRKRFVEEGLERALGRNNTKNYERKLDGEQLWQLLVRTAASKKREVQ